MGLSCARAEQLIEELLDDGLDEPRREALDEHLGGCPACRRFCRSAEQVREIIAYGSEKARQVARATMDQVRTAIRIRD